MVHVVMPQFGETVAEGELTRWLVGVGDTVVVDQPIAEISTDKVDTEVVASAAGQVTALLVEVGTVVEVGGARCSRLDEERQLPTLAERPRPTLRARRDRRRRGVGGPRRRRAGWRRSWASTSPRSRPAPGWCARVTWSLR